MIYLLLLNFINYMKYLVIVESPAKITKIEGYLNKNKKDTFIVKASYGHIAYFKNGLKSIDINNNFTPTYAILKDKKKVVQDIKQTIKKQSIDEVIIATDLDREGEAIGYHIAEALKLNKLNTKRIVFNEITEDAIIKSIKTPGVINMDLFYSQQARSIIDILIGFKISPVLWKHIKPKISAGRCQTPALKLIYERNIDINNFKAENYFNINALININSNKRVNCKFKRKIQSITSTKKLLNELYNTKFTLDTNNPKRKKSKPPPPYITSSIQQDASINFNFSPKLTMSILQKLYEAGKITYMRTDSLNMNNDFKKTCKNYIQEHFKGNYKSRNYKSKSHNAEEAHECIRPVNIAFIQDDIGDSVQRKLYHLIWKRTLASQMIDYEEDIYIFEFIDVNKPSNIFTHTIIKPIKLGHKNLYKNRKLEELYDKEVLQLLLNVSKHKDKLYKIYSITGTEEYTKPKTNFSEASLVKELEKKGIGRPSTFSNIISKLLDRKYVIKGDKEARKISLNKIHLINGVIKETKIEANGINNKNKLIITNLGVEVSKFMEENFSKINSYKFTDHINTRLDKICSGDENWYDVVSEVYNSFNKNLDKINYVKKLADFKELITIGDDKYQYKQDIYGLVIRNTKDLDTTKRLNNITNIREINKEILHNLFNYPKYLGKYLNKDINIKYGQYGFYITHGNQNIGIESGDIVIKEVIDIIKKKNDNILKEWKNIKIINGQYGIYIKKGKRNIPIKLPKEEIIAMSLIQCEEYIKNFKQTRKKGKKYKNTKKNKYVKK